MRQLPRSEVRLHRWGGFLQGDSRSIRRPQRPTVINRAYSLEQFWDGRALARRAGEGADPDAIEMGRRDDWVECIRAVPGYRKRSAEYLTEKTASTSSRRPSLRSSGRCSPATRPTTSSRPATRPRSQEPTARHGDLLLDNARCDSCHEGVNFTNGKYANMGIGADRPIPISAAIW